MLDEVATAISMEVPVFGKEPPSLALEPISERTFKQGAILDGGRTLRKYNAEHPAYVELAIRRSDQRKALKQIEKNWNDLEKATGHTKGV